MYKFSIKFFSFGFFLLLVFVLLFSFNKLILSRMYQPDRFNIENDIRTIIVGDSHPKTSLDPLNIKNSISICVENELFLFTLEKLRLLLKHNSSVKNIIIGFSYHNITERYNLFCNEEYEQLFDIFFPILPDSEIVKFRKYTVPYYEKRYKYQYGVSFQAFKDEVKFLSNQYQIIDYPFLGGYRYSIRSNLDTTKIKDKINQYYYFNGSELSISQTQIKNLSKILDYCKTRSIRVFLYNSPIFKFHNSLIPSLIKRRYEIFIKSYIEKYKNIYYLNYSKLILPDSCFGDGDHVNSYGAKILSVKIDSILADIK